MNAQPSIAQQNMMARSAILAGAIDMWQEVFSTTLSSNIAGSVVNIAPRYVGLIKRFVVELTFTVARSASETQTRTSYGPANALSQVILTDLANQNRVQTTGWHLFNLATARRNRAFGAAFTNDSPVDYGSNFDVISAPASFTTGSQTVKVFYEIPVSYSDFDLRGAIFANVVNATMNLQLTINPNFFCSSTADETLSVYQSSSADLGAISACTIKVYQNYLDQLPQGKSGPVLPMADLSTAYLLNNTVATGMSVGQDLAIPFANFRSFLSTFLLFDNGGTLNVGTDVNYLAIQSANYTNIYKVDPYMNSLQSRLLIGDDYPPGTYYLDHRVKPINTQQYGNMQAIINPATVNSGAQVLVGYEALALINQVVQAGSLYNT